MNVRVCRMWLNFASSLALLDFLPGRRTEHSLAHAVVLLSGQARAHKLEIHLIKRVAIFKMNLRSFFTSRSKLFVLQLPPYKNELPTGKNE
jgi:hypothetical protein